MAPRKNVAPVFDDVQVLGAWNFTLQGDTPLHWLRSGVLDRYHMKFTVSSNCPSTWGIVLHAEADGSGTDGVSFWSERRKPFDEDEAPFRRYLVSGQGLDSRPIITKSFQDDGGRLEEEVEVMMQGYEGAILMRHRKMTLKFRMKHDRGSVAFYNSTQADVDEVHFAGVRITALRRGPLEVAGMLGRVERSMLGLDRPKEVSDEKEAIPAASSMEDTALPIQVAGDQGSLAASSSLALRPAPPALRQGRPGGLDPGSVLRKSGSSLMGLSKSSVGRVRDTKTGIKWVATALNPHESEQKLVKETIVPARRQVNACNDFIMM